MKILIVEDEERLASFLFRGLKAEGYFCDVATDGEKALQACLYGDYELVILDRMLPKKDGMYVLTKIKEKKPETKVLMLACGMLLSSRFRSKMVKVAKSRPTGAMKV